MKTKKHFSKVVGNKKPSAIKESFSFAEEEEPVVSHEEDYDIEDEEMPCKNGKCEASSYISQIRKICLQGMSELCDTPEDEIYQKLKKIFQLVDKSDKPQQDGKVNESKRYFAVDKKNKDVIAEINCNDIKKNGNIELIKEDLKKNGYETRNIKLVAESKIIK